MRWRLDLSDVGGAAVCAVDGQFVSASALH